MNQLVDEFELSILKDPYDSSNYDKALGALVTFPERALAINKVYSKKIEYFRLTQSELNHWLFELRGVENVNERLHLEYVFYQTVIEDYNIVPIVQSFLVLAQQLLNEERITQHEFRKILSKSLGVCSYDFRSGNAIWTVALSYFESVYLKSQASSDLDTLITLHKKRLTCPHVELENSFQEYSSLISKYMPEYYEEQMGIANGIFSATKSKMKYYEKYESEIQKSPLDCTPWVEYMEGVFKYSNNIKPVMAIFERSIQGDVAFLSKWQQVWLAFIHMIDGGGGNDDGDDDEKDAKENELKTSILAKYVRTFPNSCHAYSESIRNCILSTESGCKTLEEIQRRIKSVDLTHTSDYNDWKLVATALIHVKYQKLLYSSTALVETNELMTEMVLHFDFALENTDKSHLVERLVISICKKLGKIDNLMDLLERLYKKFANESEVWLYVIRVISDLGKNATYMRYIYKKAMNSNLDDPEKVAEEWLLYEQVNGNMTSYKEAVAKCRNVVAVLAGKASQFEKTSRKRSRDIISAELSRSREEYTVQVSDLPKNTTADDLKKLFEDCGTIRDLTIMDVDDEKQAMIEFSSELDVFAALTRSRKYIGDREITINQVQKSLLFVNNYPSTYSQLDVREVFERVGPLVSCRFPSQISNKVRRFCYIQYVNANDAQRAIGLYNGQTYWDENLNRELTWEVKYSKPQERKERSSPISERKIRVTNINFSITEEELRREFSECGEIESIVLPKAVFDTKRKIMKQNGGTAIIAFRDVFSVERALKKNGTNLKGREINVRQQAAHSSRTPEDFDELKTVGLINLDPSLNTFQVKNYLEQAFGHISKILLIPEAKVGLVEFASVQDAGKLGLKSTCIKIDNYEIQTGTKTDVLSLINIAETESNKSSLAAAPETSSALPAISLMPTSLKRRRI
ncbi:PRP24 [Candida oxycetoniae]|uniref:PRP24 n=1 Tax=Candida oxycetoniae TaxID=497107 RepID=A0AAI9SYA1_9ASCO|nr:PRP24 [Candida oxycetoniae]KAI3404825.2 PRP24 [Candida oxycetoniae]